MTLTSLAEANRYLARFHDSSHTRYTLDNIRALMRLLDNPQDKFKAVHVAGTSGKTSTAYYMSALLTAAGKKTGLTVSPHVDSLTERIQINGQPINEIEFCRALSEFLEAIRDPGVTPSWFEVVISFAYWYFARQQVEYAVVEVGLGGLLDATNVMSRADKVCLLTDIGLDHMKVLGNSLAEIAAQKAGIVQPGNVAFTFEQSQEVMAVFSDWCHDHKAELKIVVADEPDPTLPAYQNRNWKLAHSAYRYLLKRDLLPDLTSQALADTKHIIIPGRMDIRRYRDKTIVMDGAHNQQKMMAFLDSLKRLYPGVKPAVLIALKEGKEYRDIIPLLKPVIGRLIVTGFESSQDIPLHSMDPAVLARAFTEAGFDTELVKDPRKAYNELLRSDEWLVVVTGSFYLLSQIRNNEA